MTRHVGAYDAKSKLSELLRDVQRGERIVITLRGKAIAELGPPRGAAPVAADAVAAMRAFKPVKGVSAKRLAQWIGEGRH